MTDNEIIKALECCAGDDGCDVCPMYKPSSECITELQKQALDLINRQKAELENQSENFKVLVSDHRTLQQSFDNLKGLYEAEKAKVEKAKEKCIKLAKELQTARAELKETTEKFNCQQHVYADLSNIIKEKIAEIEMLQTEKEKLRCVIGDLSNNTEQAKAEAIKECIEKTQEFLSTKCRGVVEDNPNLDEILYGYRVEDVDEFFDNLVKEKAGDTE